ncbi:MAG TPA: GNAT family N-acetyltransferase [Pseudolysinimonas sp.]|nr:GNAT family N-acetyltransferase [Pseudolysinimonas sp.]
MAIECRHEAAQHRYTLLVDGSIVSALQYADHGTSIAFTHTVTVPPARGKGYADTLVTFAVDDVEARAAGPISANCWYVADWFDRHPERSALLAAR